MPPGVDGVDGVEAPPGEHSGEAPPGEDGVEAPPGDDRTATSTGESTAERFARAARRDEAARLRDLAAQARERSAEVRDRNAAERQALWNPVESFGSACDYARAVRAHAAIDRGLAAADRAQAALDRKLAAEDRRQAEADLQRAHIDELTGAYTRGLGTMALQRELDRARHSDGRLVLAFVDVDDLKVVNDTLGHDAGDRLLRGIVDAIRANLRSYDPIVRVGGDEFICALAGADLDETRERFIAIQESLRVAPGASISVGLAELLATDTLEDLRRRGDEALYVAKRRQCQVGRDARVP
jgi:diguanylate cyclase (GGDEF)-like protein